MLAECHISCTAVFSRLGSPMPPRVGSKGSPFQPPSTSACHASPQPSAVRAMPSAPSLAPWTSPMRFSGARMFSAIFAASPRMLSTMSGLASSKPGRAATSAMPARWSRTKRISFSGGV